MHNTSDDLKNLTPYSILLGISMPLGTPMSKCSLLFPVIFALALISGCAQKSFNAFDPNYTDSPPKTPGYYNPNSQKYGMPSSNAPVVENEFYWKKSHDSSVSAPN